MQGDVAFDGCDQRRNNFIRTIDGKADDQNSFLGRLDQFDQCLFCAAQETVPDCVSGDGCCSPYCDLTQPNTCPGAPLQECVPWYNEGMAPPGQENIGACQIPV